MSKDLDDAMFRLIDKVDKINKLNEMKEMGAAPRDTEDLEEEIGNLQMNSILGGLFDED
jgi:hypothetical protein